MTPKKFLVTLAITAGLLLAGCVFNRSGGEADLSGISWLLTELVGSPVTSPPHGFLIKEI